MNFASVACMVALCGREYLLCFEDIIHWSQCAGTIRQPRVQDGAQARGGWWTPAYPSRSSCWWLLQLTFLSVCRKEKKGGKPLAKWLRLLHRCPRLLANAGPRRKMECTIPNFTACYLITGCSPLVQKVPNFKSTKPCFNASTQDQARLGMQNLGHGSVFFCCCFFPRIHRNRWLFLPRSW